VVRKTKLAAQSRSDLDHRFSQLGSVTQYVAPTRGWVKAVREALGLTTAQLALRLRVKQPSVVALEQSEEKGTIELATLRRVAEALDCTVVYALVPRKPLDKMVRERAGLFLRQRQEAIEHSMLLEDQKVNGGAKDADALIDEIVRETNPRLFWD
jgi:predicted DNA-binding mobile mystery protein A